MYVFLFYIIIYCIPFLVYFDKGEQNCEDTDK